MKIVKFKNGKYGVRRWTLVGYEFAVNSSGDWSQKSNKLVQEFDSKDYAVEVLDLMKRIKLKNKDMGQ